ncbi:MAG: LLM class flavin-dependent oxidoreductase [Caulobacterales bacterium]
MIPFSVLDLSPLVEGGDVRRALDESLALAQKAEALGFNRVWVAEHHNMPGIASAATSIVIAHIGAGTSKIRIGAGGIMLPNHAPLQIAEQFGTLEALFPGRVDLGLGRAPGTDQTTAYALRRTMNQTVDSFPRDVMELQTYFGPPRPNAAVRAFPGEGAGVPLWILGSSLFGAQLAAALGLPFAFASHFAPAQLMQALEIYRAQFQPSETLEQPYAMIGVGVIAAPTDEEAVFLSTSQMQSFVSLRTGRPHALKPPIEGYEKTLSADLNAMLAGTRAVSAIGSPQTVKARLNELIDRTQADELIISSQIYDLSARLRSLELIAGIRG